MPDKEFLTWIWTRLNIIHGEPRNIDYMRKLWSIIEATPADRITPNTALYPSEKD